MDWRVGRMLELFRSLSTWTFNLRELHEGAADCSVWTGYEGVRGSSAHGNFNTGTGRYDLADSKSIKMLFSPQALLIPFA